MKTLWLKEKLAYDGTQLRPLRNYLVHGLLGDSVVGWLGPCNIPPQHMVDGEDLRDSSEIRGDLMVHFIFELFHVDLAAAVSFQRLFTSMIGESVFAKTGRRLRRSGDDLYEGTRKFNISIAAPAINSCMIHAAVNVVNEGTPVDTCALADFGLRPEEFAAECMALAAAEWKSIREATLKVHALVGR